LFRWKIPCEPAPPTFQSASIAIRDRLTGTPPKDVLPGIKTAQITSLTNAVTQYAAGVTAPGDQKNENSKVLEIIVANIGKLAGLRHQVQLAAEQAFPYRNPGVASIRKSFLLPTDRPLPGWADRIARAAFGYGGRFFSKKSRHGLKMGVFSGQL
jgi:hypothetical protein